MGHRTLLHFQCRPVSGVSGHFQVPLTEATGSWRRPNGSERPRQMCVRYVMSHVTGKIKISNSCPTANAV